MSRVHPIALAGIDFIPDLSGALHAPDFRALLVADLHLEKGTSLARRGIHLPPYDTQASLAMLRAALAATKPERLIFLGDSYHDAEARGRIAAENLAELRAIASYTETVWISGNHDPLPPGDVGGTIVSEVAFGPIVLRHEPRRLGAGEFEIAGHLHPAAAVASRGRRIRCRCFVANGQRIILPAFGAYTGALDIGSRAFDGLLGDFSVWMIGARAIHRLSGKRVI